MSERYPLEPCYVFYDEVCATCHFVVKFLLRRKRVEQFRFIPVQRLNAWRGEPEIPDSIRVVENGCPYERSAAVLMILSRLGWPWRLFAFFKIWPRALLDVIYDLYAQNRYRIAGRAEASQTCQLPPKGRGALLLDDIPDRFVMFEDRPRAFLNGQWLNLVFLNYKVDPEILAPHVPDGTLLDTHEGDCYVSIVGFVFGNSRLGSWQFPGHASFEEVNLRFYVRREIEVNG